MTKRIIFLSAVFLLCLGAAAQSTPDSLSNKFSLKSIIDYGDNVTPPRFKNYYDVIYGLGPSEMHHYLGFTYTHIPKRLGGHVTALKGINVSSLSLMVGPTYTAKLFEDGRNIQGYLGIGGTYSDSLSFAFQGGVRYCLNKGLANSTEYLSFSGGIMYIEHSIVPSVGVSIVPAAKKIGEWWSDEEYRFPHHYSEAVFNYGSKGVMLGANYTYIPSKVGIYGSCLFGMDSDNPYTFNIGGALRLTDSYSTSVDIQLIQGIGMANGFMGGETGFRFGFGRDSKYGKWSLSTLLNYSPDKIGASIGVSWPIAGIAAVAVGVVAYGYLMASSEKSTVSNSSSGSSGSSSGSRSSGGKCKTCQGSGKCSSMSPSANKYYCHGAKTCQYCNGGVATNFATDHICTACKGKNVCKYCHGTGLCKDCKGTGGR